MINNYVTDSLEIGTQLNNYIIQSILGRGAFGITYLALDQTLEHLVAIKEYLPQELAMRDEDNTVHSLSGEKGELFQYGLESFLREARTIVKFRHPNIVSVLTLFRKNNTAYMVMEYEKGKTLKEYVKDKNNIAQQNLLSIFSPINDGLLFVHQRGYIHRDIKPDNIVIREDNTPVLIDFGTARDTLNTNSDDLTQIFTNGYAPFEQCHPTWAKQGPWTDIYSLGATLYFAITGKRIVAAQLRMLNDPYESLAISDLNKTYTTAFLKAIDDALLFQPTERPQSLEEWNKDLNLKNKETVIIDEIKSNDNMKLSSIELAGEKYQNRPTKGSLNLKLALTLIFLIAALVVPIIYYFYLYDRSDNVVADQYIPQNDIEKNVEIKKDTQVSSEKNNTTEPPEEIKNIISSANKKLLMASLSFSNAVVLCNAINKHLNDGFYTGLRETYLTSLQKTLSLIPKVDIKEEHREWKKIHKNNIMKNESGEYGIDSDFKKMLLTDKYLYGSLKIESPSIVLAVKIAGNDTMCSNSNPCKTPVKNDKIKSGEKVINFNHKENKINIDNTITIHPNQDFILYLK